MHPEDAITGRSPQHQQLLRALAAFGGEPVGAQHLAAMTGEADATPDLEALARTGPVRSEDGCYRLLGSLVTATQQTSGFAASLDTALHYFTGWVERSGEEPEQIYAEVQSVLGLLDTAATSERWSAVLRLARAVDGALAVSKRWGSWEKVLDWQLKAARALGDTAAEAHASHQLGTCRLCLGDTASAKNYLTRAIELRDALNDIAGAALSRHNLAQIVPLAPVEQDRSGQTKQTPKVRSGLLLKGGIALSLLAIPAAIYFATRGPRQLPIAVPPLPKSQPSAKPFVNPVPSTPQVKALTKTPITSRPKTVVTEVAKPPSPVTPAAPVSGSVEPTAPAAQQPEGALEVRPTSLAFGALEVAVESSTQGSTSAGEISIQRRRSVQTEERRVTLSNESRVSLKIIRVSITGSQPADFSKTVDSCSDAELTHKVSCTVRVLFAPKGTGTRSATLRIDHSAAGSPMLVNLSGTGTASGPQ